MTHHPRVFVVNEPLKRDLETGAWNRTMDLTPAERHGELVFLLPPGNGPRDPRPIIDTLHNVLETFTEHDFLLPVGHPLYIAWAAAIAADKTNGTLRMLVWEKTSQSYRPVTAKLWEDEEALELAPA